MKLNKDKIMKGLLLFSTLLLLLVITMSVNKEPVDKVNNNISNENNSNNNQTEEKEEQSEVENKKTIYDKIDNNNYSFVITTNINNEEKYITGNVNNKVLEVIIDNQTIIRTIDDFNNIRDYFKYINISNIKRVISLAMINNNDNNTIITYDVDVIDLIDIFNPDLDYDSFSFSSSDKLIATFENEYLKKVEIDYSNYYKYIDSNNTNLNITIEYNY